VHWSDEDDAVIGGDLTAALACVTPAGGSVVTAVAPIGLRDREAGTVSFTTSLGFGRKLDRIRAEPRVALAYHAREHGFSSVPRYVLVQGRATFDTSPDQRVLDEVVRPQSVQFMGKPKQGFFWDRWLREYYQARVPVHVDVERIVTWPDLRCAGVPRAEGLPLPAEPPAAQRPPRGGVGPRVDAARAGRRVRGCAHVLLGFDGVDGRPVVVPVEVAGVDAAGLRLTAAAPLPPGGRRAGLLGHSYQPQLIGLEARQYTGWLEVAADGAALYAPHTEHGYRAPANKTLLLLLNGALAKRGMRQARASRA
jgi:hypothetical protein